MRLPKSLPSAVSYEKCDITKRRNRKENAGCSNIKMTYPVPRQREREGISQNREARKVTKVD